MVRCLGKEEDVVILSFARLDECGLVLVGPLFEASGRVESMYV